MVGYIFITKKDEDLVKFLMGNITCKDLDKYISVAENDYEYYEMRLFDYINVECEILIDKYEEETLTNDKIVNAIEITEILINNSDDTKFVTFANSFLEILKYAYENGKNVEFKF